MGIGQELLNVPMGDMIRQMAFAIADGQAKLDENSINTAEMMGGLTTVYDEEGKVSFDDSRVFFGYEYMNLAEAVSYAIMDDMMTGTLDADEANSMLAMVKKIAETFGVTLTGTGKDTAVPSGNATLPDGTTVKATELEIRMPTRMVDDGTGLWCNLLSVRRHHHRGQDRHQDHPRPQLYQDPAGQEGRRQFVVVAQAQLLGHIEIVVLWPQRGHQPSRCDLFQPLFLFG